MQAGAEVFAHHYLVIHLVLSLPNLRGVGLSDFFHLHVPMRFVVLGVIFSAECRFHRSLSFSAFKHHSLLGVVFSVQTSFSLLAVAVSGSRFQHLRCSQKLSIALSLLARLERFKRS
jgi:hypothetical protein